jgi:hypothetical protein
MNWASFGSFKDFQPWNVTGVSIMTDRYTIFEIVPEMQLLDEVAAILRSEPRWSVVTVRMPS